MLWIEKYRPKKLEDVVLTKENRNLFQSFIDKKEIPHLMFTGKAGTGKTTVAKILIRELEAETLELNASDDRGIGVVRDKIKSFMYTELLLGKRLKVVFLDEADSTTGDFQTAMRRMLEDYSDLSRVIFSLNYKSKMIEPIVSRCQTVEFGLLPVANTAKLFTEILVSEKIEYDIDELYCLAEDCQGDLRKGVGTLQKDSANKPESSKAKGKFIYSKAVLGNIDVDALMKMAKAANWNSLYKAVQDIGDYPEVYRRLFDTLWPSNDKGVAIVCEYMYRHGVVFDPILNLLGCLRELSKYLV